MDAVPRCRAGVVAAAVLVLASAARAQPAADPMARGRARLEQGDFEGAIAAFSDALRANPRAADAYYHRAVAYHRKGSSDRAIADYSEAIRLDPRLSGAYCGRGFAYHQKRDYRRAIASRRRAPLDHDPTA